MEVLREAHSTVEGCVGVVSKEARAELDERVRTREVSSEVEHGAGDE
jgi:hypothetical protein